jgi:hypothetical protein
MGMDDDTRLTEAELDALLSRASALAPKPSDAFMARVMADAEAHLPRAAAPHVETRERQPGFFARMLGQIGGVPGAAGLVAAGFCGVTVGYADLGLVDGAAAALGLEVADYDLTDLYAGFPTVSEDG